MDNPNRSVVIVGIVILVVVVGGLILAQNYNAGPGKLDSFAQCLKDKGAKFYGAFWCPHCQNQKAMFGSSKKYLPYIECSTPDGQNQLPICKDNGVSSYPTWVFPDLSTSTGEIQLNVLAEKTSCQLPE